VCKNCHSLYKDGHECKQYDIETVKQILSDTKPCPKCLTRISKIEGCDQMFCVSCFTAFSWNTGHIENGKIHNPHYFELIRTGKINIETNLETNEPIARNSTDMVFKTLFNKPPNVVISNIIIELKNIDRLYNQLLMCYLHNSQSRRFNKKNEFLINYNNRIHYLINLNNEQQFINASFINYIFNELDSEISVHFQEFQNCFLKLLKKCEIKYYETISFFNNFETNSLLVNTGSYGFDENIINLFSEDIIINCKYKNQIENYKDLIFSNYQLFKEIENIRVNQYEKVKNLMQKYDKKIYFNDLYFQTNMISYDFDKVTTRVDLVCFLMKICNQIV